MNNILNTRAKTKSSVLKKKALSSICLAPVVLACSGQFAYGQLVNTATVNGTPDVGTLTPAKATESVTLQSLIESSDDSATGINGEDGATNCSTSLIMIRSTA